MAQAVLAQWVTSHSDWFAWIDGVAYRAPYLNGSGTYGEYEARYSSIGYASGSVVPASTHPASHVLWDGARPPEWNNTLVAPGEIDIYYNGAASYAHFWARVGSGANPTGRGFCSAAGVSDNTREHRNIFTSGTYTTVCGTIPILIRIFKGETVRISSTWTFTEHAVTTTFYARTLWNVGSATTVNPPRDPSLPPEPILPSYISSLERIYHPQVIRPTLPPVPRSISSHRGNSRVYFGPTR